MSGKHVARVREMLRTADGQETYLEWFKSDMTQTMLAAARDLAHPRMQLVADASHALQENGRIIGAYEVIDFFSNPQGGTEVESTPNNSLKPTYGSEQIRQEQMNDSE